MKKTVLSLLFTSISFITFSQGRKADVESSFRLRGGYNIANITISENGDIDKANNLNSFHFGIVCDLPLSAYLSFQGGLFYTGKGSKTENGTPGNAGYFKATTNPMYVEIPLAFVGKIPVLPSLKILAGAGGYGAIAVLGKNKTEFQAGNVVEYGNRNIDFSDNDQILILQPGYPKMKRIDYGLVGIVGVELKHFTLTANYEHGLLNVIPGTSNNKGKNRNIALSFGLKI